MATVTSPIVCLVRQLANPAGLRTVLPMILVCAAPCHGQQTTPPADSSALYAQALAAEHGEGVSKDVIKASELYCEAARLGHAQAQFNLGWMYANGRGVARS